MKKTTLSLATTMLCVVYTGAVLAWPLRAVEPLQVVKNQTIPASSHASWPAYGSSAIASSEYGLLASSPNGNKQVPIASITKIITTLVVLEAKPLKQGETGPTITFTEDDVARYNQYIMADGSVGPVTNGMQLTEQQLLQVMLLRSANNYADSVAIWAYGSMDAYLAAAKTYLAKHSLPNTNIADASGFSPNSISTASDLVRIGLLAMQDPVVADIVSQKSAVIPTIGTFYNTNKLLGTDGIVGLKTGTTDEAGSCLLFTSKFQKNNTNITLVGVVLGAPDAQTLFSSVSKLTEDTTASFKTQALPVKKQNFATYLTPWGASASVIAKQRSATIWGGSDIHAVVTVAPAPIDGSTHHIGKLTHIIGEQSTSSELMLDKPLAKPSILWRLTHPGYVFNI